MVCFICHKPDTNLCEAGVIHTSKTAVDKQHVKDYFSGCMGVFLQVRTELTYAFGELGNSPRAISEENIRLIELFIPYV